MTVSRYRTAPPKDATVATVTTNGSRHSVDISNSGELSWDDLRFPAAFCVLGIIAAVGVATAPGERPVIFAVALVAMAVAP